MARPKGHWKFKSGMAGLAGMIILLHACTPDEEVPPSVMHIPVLPSQPMDYEAIDFPELFHILPMQFFEDIPSNNLLTNEGATLGRVLFYDNELSSNRTTSCSSCHHQEHGFADTSPSSTGHKGGHTRRNSMHLVNAQFNSRFFWDQRANGLEQQVLMPIQDSLEMGMNLDELESRLSGLTYYPPLFEAAFGDPEITADRISKALAQFVRAIVSYHTKYDEGLLNDFSEFTPQELQGRDLFFGNNARCSHCHMTIQFYNPQALCNGLDAAYTDNGFGEFTGNPEDNAQFKVPSLRNVAVTGPYMHDGRFTTLDQVVAHYNSGVQPHPNLDDRLTVEGTFGGTPRQMNMSDEELAALVSFLHTLTDYSMLNDPKFSDPFAH